jgi:hypothetical protein
MAFLKCYCGSILKGYQLSRRVLSTGEYRLVEYKLGAALEPGPWRNLDDSTNWLKVKVDGVYCPVCNLALQVETEELTVLVDKRIPGISTSEFNSKEQIHRNIHSNSRDRRSKVNMELLNKEHKVAYYLSRFEHDNLFPHYTQTQAFEVISEILGVKMTTLRNKRDLFDPFCNKIKTKGPKRKGWWQKDRLPDDMERIYNRYLHVPEEEIEKDIKEILNLKVEI